MQLGRSTFVMEKSPLEMPQKKTKASLSRLQQQRFDSLGFRGHGSTLQDIVAEDELLRFPKARESLTETP